MNVETSIDGNVVTVLLFLDYHTEPGALCGRKTDARYIQTLTARYNGEKVFGADLSAALSDTPFLRFRFRGAAGGSLDISWNDNRGQNQLKRVDVS